MGLLWRSSYSNPDTVTFPKKNSKNQLALALFLLKSIFSALPRAPIGISKVFCPWALDRIGTQYNRCCESRVWFDVGHHVLCVVVFGLEVHSFLALQSQIYPKDLLVKKFLRMLLNRSNEWSNFYRYKRSTENSTSKQYNIGAICEI